MKGVQAMTDELLTRLWADSRNGFSADFDRGTLKLERHLRRRRQVPSIGGAYTAGRRGEAHADDAISPAARAALAGVSACLATMGLLVTIALLTMAGLHPANAYPMITHTIVA
jgi:hypothetical protein